MLRPYAPSNPPRGGALAWAASLALGLVFNLAFTVGLSGCDDAVSSGAGPVDFGPRPDAAPECRFHSECGAAGFCVAGRCQDQDPVDPCLSAGACPDAASPDRGLDAAVATDRGTPDARLDARVDAQVDARADAAACGPDEVPTDGGCAPDPAACARNADCDRGFACDGATRRCVPEVRLCVSRLDCFAGERCLDGRCQPQADGGQVDRGPADAEVEDGGLDGAGGAGGQDGAGGQGGDGGQGGVVVFPDLGEPDLGDLDLAVPDLGVPDLGDPDLGPPDAARFDQGPPDAFVELPTPERGIYEYERLPLANQRELNRVLFHPDGTYAVVLPLSGPVFAVDWATGAVQRFETPGNRVMYWTDLAFEPGGRRAILVGNRYNVGPNPAVDEGGLVYHFDDAAYRAGAPEVLAPQDATLRPGEQLMALEYPPEGGRPIALISRRVGGGYNAILRDYDAEAGAWGPFIAATVTSGGASDLTHVRDDFGEVGILVTCGLNGADFHFYAFVGGVGEWRARPGGRNVGNLGAAAAHPSRDYALFISWSGSGRIHRFDFGALRAEQVAFGTQNIWRVAFQPDGRRALVVGRQSSAPLAGRVIEYRHERFACPAPFGNCDLTDVSIPGFDLPPYNADSNHRLNDAAFHPRCDGGLVVGGYSNFNTNLGHLIRFQIANGAPCR